MSTLRLSLLLLCLVPLGAFAQLRNHQPTYDAILSHLPEGVTAQTATADQIGQAALELALGVNSAGEKTALTQTEMQDNLTQVMLSLVEMTRAGMFPAAPLFGDDNPPGRMYLRVLNVASSNLDVASSTYYGTTTQYIIGLTAAMREGQNLANGASSNAITRK